MKKKGFGEHYARRPTQAREWSSAGGVMAHRYGVCHRWTPATARLAALKRHAKKRIDGEKA